MPWRGGAAVLGLALMLGGCSADVAMFRADSSWWNRGRAQPEPLAFTPAGAEGLVGPDGCPADPSGAMRSVGLGMTECDLIRLAGPTERIDIATNERGQRTAVITYPQGDRAGIYRFTSGVLVSVERAPDPPASRRPPRRAPPRQPS